MLAHRMFGELGNCLANWKIYIYSMKCVTQNTSYIIGQCSELTVSRHLLRHCFWPIVEHGNSVSCSCNSAGFPVGGSGEPFLNWPLKKTAHVHAACSTFANFNPSAMVAFSLISSLSSAVFTCEAVDNLILISASAISNNWDDTCILGWGIRHFFFLAQRLTLAHGKWIRMWLDCGRFYIPLRMDGKF